MVKYNYNTEMEAFKRNDNRGKPLYVNITEAQRIVSLLELGYSVSDVCGKISLNNPKGTVTTIKSFIRNYNEGNITIPQDAPAPALLFDSVDDEARISELERRVSRLEKAMNNCMCNCNEEQSIGDKVKKWWKK